MPSQPYRRLVSTATIAGALCCLAPTALYAQDSEHDWHKQYQISDKAALNLDVTDVATEIHSCGDCKSIHIRVHSDRKLSEFRLEEHQEQDHVSFLFKEKPHIGFHFQWQAQDDKTKVTIETPGTLQLDSRSGDGSLRATGIAGDLTLHSADGALNLDSVHGNLHLTSSDGSITLHNGSGVIEARGSDGHIKIDGQFSAMQLHTSDGSLDVSLAPGSHLSASSRLESSDGSVTLRLPHDLAADLDISASDGHIDCSIPVTLDHDKGRQHYRGQLNAGGVPLTVHTSDGNVSVSAL